MACRFIRNSYYLWNTTTRLPLRTAVNCPSFIVTRDFHIAEINFKRRKTKEEKQAPRIIEYSPKKRHDPNSNIVDIWRNMTVKQLAENTGRDIEHVQEAMLYVKDSPDIHPRTKLEDINIIKDIVKKCGMRIRIVAAPSLNKQDEEEKDRDVEKRPPADAKDLKSRAPVVTVMG
jgi:translation initiation factor IF-2